MHQDQSRVLYFSRIDAAYVNFSVRIMVACKEFTNEEALGCFNVSFSPFEIGKFLGHW